MKLSRITLSLFSIFTIFFCSLCQSQNTFEFTIKDTLTDQLINDAIELVDGSYVLLGQKVSPSDQSEAHLYRISRSGKLLGTKTLTFQGHPSGFIKIIQINPNLFMLSGFTITNSTPNLWLSEMDSLFNEVRSKIMMLGSYNLYYLSDLTLNNSNILCSGIAESGFNHYPFIYKISPTFDSLQLRIFTEHITSLAFDLLVKNNGQGYYSIMSHFGPPTNDVIIDLDTAFLIKHIYGVPNDLTDFPEAKWIKKSTFILSGRKDYYQNPPNQGIEVLCLDTVGNSQHALFIGDHDTVEWPGLRSRLDFIDKNTIYVGGTHNFYQWSEFGPVNCWFSLNQMDTALNVNWQHFYGGDANYTMYGIRATQDKGCLMFGSRYDFQGSCLERDIYVYKVDQNGLIAGTDSKPNPKVHNVIVFPNPGTDFLMVETGPQFVGAKMIITDLKGNQVLSKIINGAYINVNTQSFSSGTYPWQIIFKNNVIEMGKWIKL